MQDRPQCPGRPFNVMPIDTPPNWKEVYRGIYKAKAFDEDSWLECAVNLLETAKLLEPKIGELWENYRAHLKDRNVVLKQDHYNGPYFMLIAYAIGNLLKAAIVRSGAVPRAARFEVDSKFPKELKGHNLLDLAEAAGVPIGLEDEDLLRRLTRNAIWSGRYPIPLHYDYSQPSEVYSDGTKYSVAFFGAKDVERLQRFVQDLRIALNLPRA